MPAKSWRNRIAQTADFLLLPASDSRVPASRDGGNHLGRGYEDFELCYADNLDFINQNTGRHLLPLVLAKGEANADGGHRMYELLGDVLRVTIRLDQSNQIIERCEIVLTAPAGMSYGTSGVQ